MIVWPIKTIGDLAEVVTKGTTPTSVGHKFTESGINFVKVESIRRDGSFIPEKFGFIDEPCHLDLKRSQLVAGDILFSIAGALGRTAFVSEDILPANTNQALAIIRLRPSESVFPPYVMKALSSSIVLEQVEKQRGGVAQQNLSLAQIKSFSIPLPPLSEQKRIVAILDDAFAGIDAAIANTEKNLASARELFESYLNTTFIQKGEGWEEKALSSLIDITHGYAFKGPDFTVSSDEKKPIVLTPGNYAEDANLYFTTKNTKRFTGKIPKDYLFEVGNLTVVMTDLSSKMKILGKPAFIDRSNILHNQRIGRVIFKNEGIVPRYIYYFLRTRAVSEKIKETSTGTMVRHTAPNRILSIDISFPTSQIKQDKIIETLDKISEETQNLEVIYHHKISSLNELKQSLLQKAFSGELTADTKIAEAAE